MKTSTYAISSRSGALTQFGRGFNGHDTIISQFSGPSPCFRSPWPTPPQVRVLISGFAEAPLHNHRFLRPCARGGSVLLGATERRMLLSIRQLGLRDSLSLELR
jgi:hypothetical protein